MIRCLFIACILNLKKIISVLMLVNLDYMDDKIDGFKLKIPGEFPYIPERITAKKEIQGWFMAKALHLSVRFP